MMDEDWERIIEHSIEGFPMQERDAILEIWNDWLLTSPTTPFYTNWEEFASLRDDPNTLYSETRIYIKKIRNKIRDMEIPQTNRQRFARALAAVASIFVVFFMAISRLFSKSE